MLTGQSPLVAFAVGRDVLSVAQPQFFNSLLNNIDTAIGPHRLRAETMNSELFQNQQRLHISGLLYSD